MKYLNILVSAPVTVAMISLASITEAQDGPVRSPFEIFPTSIYGETCVEDPDNKELKCLSLQPTDTGLVPVAELDLPIKGGQDVLVQFCAKVEDKNFQELECQVEIDSEVAAPGSLKPNENPNNTIYSFCSTWAGEAAGNGRRSLSSVDVLCERKGTTEMTEVNINSYTLSVFSK